MAPLFGGGIANLTNVAATFKGIIRALKEYTTPFTNHNIRIFVRRGGLNYQEGLKAIRLLEETLGEAIKVYMDLKPTLRILFLLHLK